MSWWAHITAEFPLSVEDPMKHVPTGSESGPDFIDNFLGYQRVSGALRDVCEEDDAEDIVEWFVDRAATGSGQSTLTMEFDYGSKYEFKYSQRELHLVRRYLEDKYG